MYFGISKTGIGIIKSELIMAAAIGNKYAVGANNGRPRKYDNPSDLQTECDGYFEYIKGEFHLQDKEVTNKSGKTKVIKETIWDRYPEPPTVNGLALYLGFASKQSLYDYEKEDVFSYPIKRALSQIEMHHEKGLSSTTATGHIFALKNSGWKDQSFMDMTSKGDRLFADKTDQQLIDEYNRLNKEAGDKT